MKTHRSTQLFLYCSGGEHSVKSVRPALENGGMQRGVVRFLVAEGAVTRHRVKNALKWEILQHPPYSPDRSPCDFHIFVDLKKDIRGRRLHSDEEVQE